MPNSGYTSSAANAVYSPYCTGTPTIVAYARLCGTRSAHTDNPATASATSHFRSYRGSQPTIGRYFFSTRRSFVSATPWTAATATVTLASRSTSYHRMNRLVLEPSVRDDHEPAPLVEHVTSAKLADELGSRERMPVHAMA